MWPFSPQTLLPQHLIVFPLRPALSPSPFCSYVLLWVHSTLFFRLHDCLQATRLSFRSMPLSHSPPIFHMYKSLLWSVYAIPVVAVRCHLPPAASGCSRCGRPPLHMCSFSSVTPPNEQQPRVSPTVACPLKDYALYSCTIHLFAVFIYLQSLHICEPGHCQYSKQSTGRLLWQSSFDSQQGHIFFSSQKIHTGTQPPIQWAPGNFSSWAKQPEPETD
jgi:hypothetical protein